MGVERLTVAGMYDYPLDAMNKLKGLPSSFAMGCNGLPHPRSRMALAAETRACAGAFLSSMIFTGVFTACTVCVRAKDLISHRSLLQSSASRLPRQRHFRTLVHQFGHLKNPVAIRSGPGSRIKKPAADESPARVRTKSSQ